MRLFRAQAGTAASAGLLANPTENDYTRMRTSKVETFLVGGTLDFATPLAA